jgi:flagellar biogenesis protein FliO
VNGLASSEIHDGWDVLALIGLLALVVLLFWAVNR